MNRLTVIALALAFAPTALAEEGRRHHLRGASSAEVAGTSPTFELDGVLERGTDGELLLALPISEATRAEIAAARGVPLSEVPAAVRRRVQPAPAGPSTLEIESSFGRRTRAVLAQDPSGETFLVALRPPVGP